MARRRFFQPIEPESVYLKPSRRGGRGKPRELTFTTLRRTRPADDDQIVPYLRMSGQWLERAGFSRGDRVVVTTEENRLVITLAPQERR